MLNRKELEGFYAEHSDQIEKLIANYLESGAKILKNFSISERLRLSDEQAVILSTSFSYYLLSKRGYEFSLQANKPENALRQLFSVTRPRVNRDREDSRVIEIARDGLKMIMNGMLESSDPESSPTPRSIANAANRISTSYAKCLEEKRSYGEELRKDIHYINERIFRTHINE